jgi:hypothetical protein
VNNSNLTEDTDIDNELNSSDIVMTRVGESKDSHIVITRKGEAVVIQLFAFNCYILKLLSILNNNFFLCSYLYEYYSCNYLN